MNYQEYIDKWTKIGLSTEKINKQKAEKTIQLIYKKENRDMPEVRWYSNPLEMTLYAALAYKAYQEAIKDPLMKKHLEEKQNYITFVDDILSKEIDFKNISLDKEIQEIKDKTISPYDVSFVATYDYLTNETFKEKEIDNTFCELYENCGYVIPFDGFCFMSERPSEIYLDKEGRLHNENGMAVKFPASKLFPDGWGVHVIHGENKLGDTNFKKFLKEFGYAGF